MGDLFRAAVIPTRDRHDMLADCINSVIDQVDRIIVLDNLSDPPIDPDPWDGKVGVVSLPIDPPMSTGCPIAHSAPRRLPLALVRTSRVTPSAAAVRTPWTTGRWPCPS